MLKATSGSNELNVIDLKNILINMLLFDLPSYIMTAANIRLGGGSWENALIQPLPVFCMAIIDLGTKFVKENRHELH